MGKGLKIAVEFNTEMGECKIYLNGSATAVSTTTLSNIAGETITGIEIWVWADSANFKVSDLTFHDALPTT